MCSKCLSQVTICKCINHKTFFDYDNVLDSWSRNVCYVHWNNRSSCAICERDAEEEAIMMTTSPDESSRYSSSAEGDGFISSMDDKVAREQVTTPSPTIKEDDPFSTTSSLLVDNLPIETGALCKFSVLLSNSMYF